MLAIISTKSVSHSEKKEPLRMRFLSFYSLYTMENPSKKYCFMVFESP